MDYYKRVININDYVEIVNSFDISGSTTTLPLSISVMLTQKIEDIGIYDNLDDEEKK